MKTRIRTTKEHDGYTAIVLIETETVSRLKYRHTGFKARHHARAHAKASARNILSYAAGSMQVLWDSQVHWESNKRNCCPIWPK